MKGRITSISAIRDWERELAKVRQCPVSTDSVEVQLANLEIIARKLGFVEASLSIQNLLNP